MRCKSLLLATVSSLAIIGAVNIAAPASAADLPRAHAGEGSGRCAAAFNWTGFYIGVHGGGAWLDHKQQITADGVGICGCRPGSDWLFA